MFASQLSLAVTLFVAIALYGCERGSELNKDSISFSESIFQRPADGKLTEKQVADYIVIRQNIIRDVIAQKLAKKKTLPELKEDSAFSSKFRHFDEIERTVANSFNMSYEEFLWIKDTVISTQTTMLVQHYYDLNRRIMTLLDKTLTRYKEINAEKLEQQEQLKMNGYVEEMKQEMANLRGKISGPNERSDSLGHNIIIVSKFKKELESLEQQVLQPFNP